MEINSTSRDDWCMQPILRVSEEICGRRAFSPYEIKGSAANPKIYLLATPLTSCDSLSSAFHHFDSVPSLSHPLPTIPVIPQLYFQDVPPGCPLRLSFNRSRWASVWQLGAVGLSPLPAVRCNHPRRLLSKHGSANKWFKFKQAPSSTAAGHFRPVASLVQSNHWTNFNQLLH